MHRVAELTCAVHPVGGCALDALRLHWIHVVRFGWRHWERDLVRCGIRACCTVLS